MKTWIVEVRNWTTTDDGTGYVYTTFEVLGETHEQASAYALTLAVPGSELWLVNEKN